MKEARGLTDNQKRAMEALLPPMLGIPSGERAQVQTAVERLDAYVKSIPEETGRERVQTLLTVVNVKSFLEHGRLPHQLTFDQRDAFVRRFFDSEGTGVDAFLDFVGEIFGDVIPSVRDLAKSVREMYALAYYTNPETDSITAYTPIWKREDIWSRDDVDRSSNPGEQSPRLDLEKIRRRHGLHVEPGQIDPFPKGHKPRVAVIGSGAGGAVVAAHLAEHGYRVAVFEAGPRLAPHEYPLDAMEGMSVLFEDGLTTLNHNLDVHLLRGRVVGGSTVLTSGMSIHLRDRTLRHWVDCGMGIDAGELRRSFAEVRDRLSLGVIEEKLTCDPGKLWRRGAENINRQSAPDVIYDFDVPVANVITREDQRKHPSTVPLVGKYCLGCGLCNYGCHFGHKLSMDLTYLADAEARGAKIHENAPVDHLIAEIGPDGRARISGLLLQRTKQRVEVDHVVVAAGAVGTPALVLRSARKYGALRDLPALREDLVGKYLGFNYGTTVVARWPNDLPKPGDAGIQINFIATKSGDEDFVLENAFLPPGLMANVVPGIGRDHRRFMESYRRLGMCVNTIGSPQHGRVRADKAVEYRVDAGEMDTIRRTLAMIVKQYLQAGACEVGLAGIRRVPDIDARFDSGWRDASEQAIARRLEAAIPDAEHIMLSSAHPQGGMRMNRDPQLGAVDPDFRVHGTSNLFVADASLFPSTIVVNPQWSVMAVAHHGARRIEAKIRPG